MSSLSKHSSSILHSFNPSHSLDYSSTKNSVRAQCSVYNVVIHHFSEIEIEENETGIVTETGIEIGNATGIEIGRQAIGESAAVVENPTSITVTRSQIGIIWRRVTVRAIDVMAAVAETPPNITVTRNQIEIIWRQVMAIAVHSMVHHRAIRHLRVPVIITATLR